MKYSILLLLLFHISNSKPTSMTKDALLKLGYVIQEALERSRLSLLLWALLSDLRKNVVSGWPITGLFRPDQMSKIKKYKEYKWNKDSRTLG